MSARLKVNNKKKNMKQSPQLYTPGQKYEVSFVKKFFLLNP